MIRLIGSTAVVLACALSIGGIVAGVLAARSRAEGARRQARLFAYGVFGLLTVAGLAMIAGLVTHDFSISYVAQVGSRATPLFFTIISLWSALEGSILFWAWVLAGYTALVAYRAPESLGPVKSYSLAVLMGTGTFFYFLLVGPASPFELVSPVPADGPGPNPLLQNHILMAVHPPLLYLGYVGFTVPFAFALGSLLAGRVDAAWIRTTRNWTLIAWGFLSLAIVMGMWWSYEVLGWGGYWAWDPVENASFMPWLTATAFLHSAMVQERRGMLKVWNLSLIIATFLLTILGTFLTRSGVLSSVHAFADGPIGAYFLGFIAVALVFSLALLAGKSEDLDAEGRLDSAVSRETAFLVNNLVLTAFTFTVLLGTLFPLLAEAVQGTKLSVGAPFFNRMTLPLAMALLFLVGVGPALPWRKGPLEEVKRRLTAPTIAFLVVTAASIAFRVPSVYAVLAFGFGAFAITTNVQEYWFGMRARMRAHAERPHTALRRLVGANRHRYGGYLAHIGVLLLALGTAASSTYKREYEDTLRVGETMQAGPYQLRLERVWAEEQPHRFVIGADVDVLRDGREVDRLDPRMNFYPTQTEPLPTPAVRSRVSDLYLNLMAFERDGSTATISAMTQPMVNWIWFGGIVIALGALVAVWPDHRRRISYPQPLRPPAEPVRKRPKAVAVGGD